MRCRAISPCHDHARETAVNQEHGPSPHLIRCSAAGRDCLGAEVCAGSLPNQGERFTVGQVGREPVLVKEDDRGEPARSPVVIDRGTECRSAAALRRGGRVGILAKVLD
jgi:hypothetical protein